MRYGTVFREEALKGSLCCCAVPVDRPVEISAFKHSRLAIPCKPLISTGAVEATDIGDQAQSMYPMFIKGSLKASARCLNGP